MGVLGKCPGPQPTSAAGGVKDSGFVRGSESEPLGHRVFECSLLLLAATELPAILPLSTPTSRGPEVSFSHAVATVLNYLP